LRKHQPELVGFAIAENTSDDVKDEMMAMGQRIERGHNVNGWSLFGKALAAREHLIVRETILLTPLPRCGMLRWEEVDKSQVVEAYTDKWRLDKGQETR
jgi:hypothetical protein